MIAPLDMLFPVGGAIAGMAAGWLHFRSLRVVAARMVAGRPSAWALQVLRLAAMAAFLVICSKAGAFTLLGAAGGVFVGRAVALRTAGGEVR